MIHQGPLRLLLSFLGPKTPSIINSSRLKATRKTSDNRIAVILKKLITFKRLAVENIKIYFLFSNLTQYIVCMYINMYIYVCTHIYIYIISMKINAVFEFDVYSFYLITNLLASTKYT